MFFITIDFRQKIAIPQKFFNFCLCTNKALGLVRMLSYVTHGKTFFLVAARMFYLYYH